MSSQPIDHQHLVLVGADRLVAELDSLAEAPLSTMSSEELKQALVTVARGRAQLDALALRLLAQTERSEATLDTVAATAADWVAVETRQSRRDTRSDLKLALGLVDHQALSGAMAAGRVNLPQARTIVRALDRLPRRGEYAVSPDQLEHAERYLVDMAVHHDARGLRALGDHLFEVIAPEVADQLLGRELEREEAAALRRTTLRMWEDDEGTCHGTFRIPALHGQMLGKMIFALASPVRPDADQSGIDPDLPTEVRHGIALTQLIENYPAKDLPRTGGCSATIVVTMTHDQLLADLESAGVCTLDTSGRISASEARRLACSAGIIPVVLGGNSQVLDVGRRRRFHNQTQRIALGIRDRGCTAEHCETPPGMCHAHHDHPWSQGGGTDVDTGRLLCPHHHRRVHDPAFVTTRLPDGKLRFGWRE